MARPDKYSLATVPDPCLPDQACNRIDPAIGTNGIAVGALKRWSAEMPAAFLPEIGQFDESAAGSKESFERLVHLLF